MYADQIEAERNGTISTDYFTDTFTGVEVPWICPNASSIRIDDNTLTAYILPCADARNGSYANNVTCSADQYDGGLWVSAMLVSTNFDAHDFYYGGNL